MAQGGSVKLAMGQEKGVKGGFVSLRIGSVNVTTMKRDGEVVDMAAKRHLDFCCLQKTGWKGKGARKMGEYKFFWMGCAKGIHGYRTAGSRQVDSESAGSEVCENIYYFVHYNSSSSSSSFIFKTSISSTIS